MCEQGELSEQEYNELKKQLNNEQLKELERLEADSSNPKVDYFEIYVRVYKDFVGRRYNRKTLRAYFDAPFTRLKKHLLIKAGKVKNIKFSK